MLARAIEQQGLPTVTLALIREHAERVKPPRALWVPYPFGYALGRADDPPFQHRIIAAALGLFAQPAGPVLAEFTEDIGAPARLLQASAAKATAADADPLAELTALRGYYERWVSEHDDRTGVGVSPVPQRRFRGLVKAMLDYTAGQTPDPDDKPVDMPLNRFFRLGADDLKAFALEARMCQRPDDRDNALYAWFWSETGLGALLARVAERMASEGDERSAQGIAR